MRRWDVHNVSRDVGHTKATARILRMCKMYKRGKNLHGAFSYRPKLKLPDVNAKDRHLRIAPRNFYKRGVFRQQRQNQLLEEKK